MSSISYSGPLTNGMRADIARLHAHLQDPEQELAALLMIAMEREQAATVDYNEHRVLERLRRSHLSQPLRQAIAHALQQAWREEAIHARYIHGLLLRQVGLGTYLRTALQQMMGNVGGWTLSTKQLKKWRTAPLSNAIAEAITAIGILTHKVAPEARAGMRYQSLREYALFNADAEWSAAVSYERMVQLVESIGEPRLLLLPANFRDEMQGACDSEIHHAELFTLLAEILTNDDTLREGLDEQTVIRQIHALAPIDAPAEHRETSGAVLGCGGRVKVVQGISLDEKRVRFQDLLESSELIHALALRAAELGKNVGDLAVAIKVDLMMGANRSDPSVVVDSEIAEALALFLKHQGIREIAVVEAHNLYNRFFSGRDVYSVARYFGFNSPHYRVVDLADEQVEHTFKRGMGHQTIGRTWRDADFRISLARLKTHPDVWFAYTLWNGHSVASQDGTFVFGDRMAEFHTAAVELLYEFPVHFGILDAYASAADGLVGFMACKRPRVPLRFYAGRDLLAVDRVAARHTGVPDPRRSAIYNEATYWFGDPKDTIEVDGPDEPIVPWRAARQGFRGKLLGAVSKPVYERLSGHGALFAANMDRSAFPPIHPSPLLDVLRWLIRMLVL